MISFGRIGRQTASLLIGRLAAQGLALLLSVILAARLGPAGLGAYAVVAAVVYVANVATTFGTDMVLTREVARGEGAGSWSSALVVQLGLSTGAVGLVWAVTSSTNGGEAASALRILALSLFPSALFSVAAATLRGAGRMGALATVGAMTAALQVAAVWVMLDAGGGLPSAMFALLAAQSVGAVTAWAAAAAVAPALRRPGRLRPGDIASAARLGAPIGVLGWLGVAYQRLGVIALGLLAGPVATGWFSSASRLVEGSKTGHVAFFGALYPAMAAAHGGSDHDAPDGSALGMSLRFSTACAILIAAALLVLGPFAVRILYGPTFAPASSAVAVLGLSVVPSTLSTYLSLELVAADREAVALRALLVSLGVVVALSAGLVLLIGWLGACWAVVGAETAQAIALWFGRRDLLRPSLETGPRRLARRPAVDGIP